MLVTAYVVVLGGLTLRQQARFGTFGFDMGIHDQGIWLLSRFERPFVTVRGLHYLGHHLNLVSLLFVPAYWLGAGPSFLYLVETVALGLGAVPVFLLARDVLGSAGRWIPLVPAAAYLLHPTVSWINWWHFHPEALAVAPLLLAVWLARRRRWRWFAACIVFVLSTKEDLALAVFALGLVLVVSAAAQRRSWRPGVVTAACGLGWYVVAMQVVMPWFHGGGEAAHYVQELYPRFGDDAPSVIAGIITDPRQTFGLLFDGERLAYYGRLLAPTGFVALLGLPWLVVTGPQVAANALSSLSTTYDARYHYSVVPAAVVAVATVHGLGGLRRLGRLALAAGLAAVVVGSLVSHQAWAVTPIGRPFDEGYWLAERDRQETFVRAMATVPADASVAATYFFVPHLAHRRLVYEWPNPWVAGNWGFANRDPDDPSFVDHLVVDTRELQQPELLASLRSSEFVETVFEEDGVVVARRRQPGARRPAR